MILFLMIIAAQSIGLFVFIYLVMKLDLETKLSLQRKIFNDLAELVWNEAKFTDDKGIADKGYDSKQVELKWNKYHELTDKFRKA
jgi:hypothetical protein